MPVRGASHCRVCPPGAHVSASGGYHRVGTGPGAAPRRRPVPAAAAPRAGRVIGTGRSVHVLLITFLPDFSFACRRVRPGPVTELTKPTAGHQHPPALFGYATPESASC